MVLLLSVSRIRSRSIFLRYSPALIPSFGACLFLDRCALLNHSYFSFCLCPCCFVPCVFVRVWQSCLVCIVPFFSQVESLDYGQYNVNGLIVTSSPRIRQRLPHTILRLGQKINSKIQSKGMSQFSILISTNRICCVKQFYWSILRACDCI